MRAKATELSSSCTRRLCITVLPVCAGSVEEAPLAAVRCDSGVARCWWGLACGHDASRACAGWRPSWWPGERCARRLPPMSPARAARRRVQVAHRRVAVCGRASYGGERSAHGFGELLVTTSRRVAGSCARHVLHRPLTILRHRSLRLQPQRRYLRPLHRRRSVQSVQHRCVPIQPAHAPHTMTLTSPSVLLLTPPRVRRRPPSHAVRAVTDCSAVPRDDRHRISTPFVSSRPHSSPRNLLCRDRPHPSRAHSVHRSNCNDVLPHIVAPIACARVAKSGGR
jgi:hypothetical protein